MTISAELEAKILRHFYVEKWRTGTIARQFNIHHSVVRRVLSQNGVLKASLMPKKSILDPYLPFVNEILTKYPTLTASRLYAMVKERGYKGGMDHFRHQIMLQRPRPAAEAYLRLRTLPGEQAQVDWGHFGYILIGKAKRPLMAFVMTLSYSRKIFLKFYLNQQISNFLRGHEAAFEAWQGVPRVILCDNLKAAVLEREGNAIRFHSTILAFSAHYRFEMRPVAVARGNEKGRVERSIRYIRDNFFAAREWKNLDDLNTQAKQWCEGQAADRPCPEDRSFSVRKVFEEDQKSLLALPDNPFPTEERIEIKVGKTPYVRFDLNDYSIPHNNVRRILTVFATFDSLRILDGTAVIAEHKRCYDREQQVENIDHIKDLENHKRESRLHRGQNRLMNAIPQSKEFLIKAAERGYNLGAIVYSLLKMLDRYNAVEIGLAMEEALRQGSPHHNSVLLYLEKRRETQKLKPPIPIFLPDKVKNIVVRTHSLEKYDQLQTMEE